MANQSPDDLFDPVGYGAMMPHFGVMAPQSFSRRAVDLLHRLPLIFVDHAALLAIPFVPIRKADLAYAVAVTIIGGLGVTIGFHRYLTHGGFKTSRVLRFLLAVAGCITLQRGPLWWAAHHRQHHAQSDKEGDPHSPMRGFLYAHLGWLVAPVAHPPNWRLVRDLARHPELRALDRFWRIPPLLACTGAYLFDGWSGVVFGYCLPVAVLSQITWSINSIAHSFGSRPHETNDTSRNVWLLGVLAFGEGWHNNHHYSPSTARHGFKWYQIDISYYVIWVMEKLGLIWDVKKTPRHRASSSSTFA